MDDFRTEKSKDGEIVSITAPSKETCLAVAKLHQEGGFTREIASGENGNGYFKIIGWYKRGEAR